MAHVEHTFDNENGLKLTVTNKYNGEQHGIMGGDDRNPTWEEYLGCYKEEYHPHFELVKKAITKLGWVGETAEHIANYWCFVFSDGTAFSFSWRAWGDLMQAIVNKKEGYMTYYM